MPKKINIHIKETLPELESMRRKASSRLKEDRLMALILIKKGKFIYQSRIAQKLGYTAKTVRGWLKAYAEKGIAACLEVNSGGNTSSVISPEAHRFLESTLSNPKSAVSSYVELSHLLWQQHKIQVKYMTLYGYCKRNFGSKLKVARKSHYKKDEQAVEAFKKNPLHAQIDKTKYK
jgi:transposase